MTYNPDQPRDERGRWGEGGGGGGKSVASLRAGSRQALGPGARLTSMPKLTPIDTHDVLLARYNNMSVPSTHTIDTPERQAMRDEAAKNMYGEGGVKGREAYMVLGLPASGKSELAEPLAAEKGALVIDSDLAKEDPVFAADYRNGAGANALHEESSDIAGRVLGRAMEAGDNVVIPMVGRNTDNAMTMAASLHAAGYRVNVMHIDAVPHDAGVRAVARYNATGRFVDPNYVINQVGMHTRNTYEALKRSPTVHSYARIDNTRGPAGPVVESGVGRAAGSRRGG